MTAGGADEIPAAGQHWLIGGRVQGVGYRMWLVSAARAAGVKGWVRNLQDGRVEAVVQGPAETLRRLAATAQRGPRLAVVDRVQVLPWSGGVDPGPFVQRDTAPEPEPG